MNPEAIIALARIACGQAQAEILRVQNEAATAIKDSMALIEEQLSGVLRQTAKQHSLRTVRKKSDMDAGVKGKEPAVQMREIEGCGVKLWWDEKSEALYIYYGLGHDHPQGTVVQALAETGFLERHAFLMNPRIIEAVLLSGASRTSKEPVA